MHDRTQSHFLKFATNLFTVDLPFELDLQLPDKPGWRSVVVALFVVPQKKKSDRKLGMRLRSQNEEEKAEL